MSPFLCPSNTLRVSSPTPAARKRRPNVCFRSCTRTCSNPHGAGSAEPLVYRSRRATARLFPAALFMQSNGSSGPRSARGAFYPPAVTPPLPRKLKTIARMYSAPRFNLPLARHIGSSRSTDLHPFLTYRPGTTKTPFLIPAPVISHAHSSMQTSCSLRPVFTLNDAICSIRVCRQFREQQVLLVPRQWIRFTRLFVASYCD